jgi:putative transposase
MSWDPNRAPPRKRSKRFNTPGDTHFLTFSCLRRQPFLSRERTCQWLADAIVAARVKHAFRLITYVFMPEHVHLLIRPTERDYDISRILKNIKQPVAQRAISFVRKESPAFLARMTIEVGGRKMLRFWQGGGGHDRNIFSPEELWEKIAYIHRNPVKRELVRRAADWKWSRAADFAKLREGPLAIDHGDLGWLR